jgi:hypothetical protein
LAYAQFHLGDGTAAGGQRVLTRASLDLMKTLRCASRAWTMTSASPGTCGPSAASEPQRMEAHWAGHILLLELVPERNLAIGILTNANVGWRLIQDVERAALKSYAGAAFSMNQGHLAPRPGRDITGGGTARCAARSGAVHRALRSSDECGRRAR